MRRIPLQPSNPPKDVQVSQESSGFLLSGGLGSNSPKVAKRAVDIEDFARWAYVREGVGQCDPGPISELRHLSAQHGDSGDGMRAVERYVSLGTNVDVPRKGSEEMIHPDALHLHGLVLGLNPIEQQLVVRCARGMGRPSWGEDLQPLRYAPVIRLNRKTAEREAHVVHYDRHRHAVYPYCPVEIVDQTMQIEAARGRYTLWWCAMNWLKKTLIANPWGLTAWSVSGFSAPECPWHKD